MMKTPIAVAALVLLGACAGSKDNTSNTNGGAMTDTSAGSVNPSTTMPPSSSSTTPSATPAPTTMPDTSSMSSMKGDTGKMSGRRHHPKKDSSMTH